VLIEFEPALLERVDAYQGAVGLPSRSETIRALIEKGLK
jgi:metal-responsive CopG/Arc/MetJ family transcriptional regulator